MLPLRLAIAAAACSLLAGCTANAPTRATPVRLTIWSHTGTPEEQAALRAQVTGFEQATPGTTVAVKIFPEGAYNDALQVAATSDRLPDLVDVDGPQVAAFAYQGALVPLDALLAPSVKAGMLQSLVSQGTWNGHLWAVGAFDSGLALYGDRRQLTAAGVRIPQGPTDAWTAEELTRALVALAARDPDHKVLDLKLDYGTGEWLTYGFSPLLSSAGAALVDPSGRASGTLDSPAAVRALKLLGSWSRYADPDTAGTAFTSRKVALSWVGHWTYGDYAKALGRDLVLIPLPDLGHGTKSGQGSWTWAVSSTSVQRKAAAALLTWLTDDASATTMTQANGAVPGTRTSLARSPLVGSGRPLHLYADQLSSTCGGGPLTRSCVTVPRPVTPAYPTITSAFSGAVATVLAGGDAHTALSKAAHAIDADLAANHGYAAPAP
jgi:multiple sugar transport system substrate-binding protein